MSNQKDYTVRATHCSHQASLDEIYDRLVEITAPLQPVVGQDRKGAADWHQDQHADAHQ